MDKDVRYFQIAMHYMVLSQVDKPLEDVLYVSLRLELLQIFPASQLALEIALVTKFRYDVTIAIACEDLVASQDIGMVQFFQDIDLREEKFFQFLAFEAVEFYDLDGDCLL